MKRLTLVGLLAAAAAAAPVTAAAAAGTATVTGTYSGAVDGSALTAPATHFLKAGLLTRVDVDPAVGTMYVSGLPETAAYNGVPVNGQCSTAQIQASVKTKVSTGTTTVQCRRTGANGVRVHFMLTYGFERHLQNCVSITASRIAASSSCLANVSAFAVAADGSMKSGEGVVAGVAAAFDVVIAS